MPCFFCLPGGRRLYTCRRQSIPTTCPINHSRPNQLIPTVQYSKPRFFPFRGRGTVHSNFKPIWQKNPQMCCFWILRTTVHGHFRKTSLFCGPHFSPSFPSIEFLATFDSQFRLLCFFRIPIFCHQSIQFKFFATRWNPTVSRFPLFTPPALADFVSVSDSNRTASRYQHFDRNN